MSKAAAAKVLDEPVEVVVEPVELAKTLDERIVLALTGTEELASSFIADLIGETEVAISAADETARVNRERAFDPTILDPVARGKSDDATFVAHRLRAGLARLQELHTAAVARERSDQWHREADAMQTIVLKLRDELVPMARRAEAAELEYNSACDAIDNASVDICLYMQKCTEIEAAAPLARRAVSRGRSPG